MLEDAYFPNANREFRQQFIERAQAMGANLTRFRPVNSMIVPANKALLKISGEWSWFDASEALALLAVLKERGLLALAVAAKK